MWNGITDADWPTEYTEARRLMGLRGTDLMTLRASVVRMAVFAPEPWAHGFRALIDEIEMREHYMLFGCLPPREIRHA